MTNNNNRMAIEDYEKILAEYGLNFKCYIWKNVKTDVKTVTFKQIYLVFQDDAFAESYIKYHRNLAMLLGNAARLVNQNKS